MNDHEIQELRALLTPADHAAEARLWRELVDEADAAHPNAQPPTTFAGRLANMLRGETESDAWAAAAKRSVALRGLYSRFLVQRAEHFLRRAVRERTLLRFIAGLEKTAAQGRPQLVVLGDETHPDVAAVALIYMLLRLCRNPGAVHAAAGILAGAEGADMRVR